MLVDLYVEYKRCSGVTPVYASEITTVGIWGTIWMLENKLNQLHARQHSIQCIISPALGVCFGSIPGNAQGLFLSLALSSRSEP